MKNQFQFLVLLFLASSIHTFAQSHFDITLQSNDLAKDETNATLRIFLPTSDKVASAAADSTIAGSRTLLILPGGGYTHLAKENEGYSWAPFFNERGIAVAVLSYRMPKGRYQVPSNDVNEAFSILREHAREWKLNTKQMGIMGSSAGGHLASTVATHNVDSLKPAFQILFYPVISMEEGTTHQGSRDNLLGTAPSQELIDNYCNEKQVTSTTPRAFIVLSDDDTAVPPTNSAQYYIALKKAGVPASLHIYPSGGHGFGYRASFKYHADMLKELSEWLESF